jgi:hypothetical protein
MSSPRCDAALIVTSDTAIIDTRTKIAVLSITNKETFDSAKQGLNGSGSGEIGGIPITADLSWESFQEKRAEFLSRFEYSSDVSLFSSWSSTYLGPNALAAYEACLRTNLSGADMWVTSSSPEGNIFGIRFVFGADSSDTRSRTLELNWVGGKFYQGGVVVQSIKIPDLVGDVERDFIFVKDSIEGSALISAAMQPSGKGSATISLPARPKVKEVYYEEVELKASQRIAALNSKETLTSYITIPTADHDEKFGRLELVPGTHSVALSDPQGEGDQGWGVEVDNKSQLKVRISVGGDAWGHGRAMTFTVSCRARIRKVREI